MRSIVKICCSLCFLNCDKEVLIEARKNNLELHNINNIDLFNLLEILLNKDEKLKKTKERAIQYASEHDVDKSVIMAVTGAANCKMDYDMIAGKGSVDMCTVFEETRSEGRLEGRLEGKLEGRAEEIIETGHEFGISEEEILTRLQKKWMYHYKKHRNILRCLINSRLVQTTIIDICRIIC
jgi:hypothetical protein